ncbi:MAG: allophanate hydrolase subunit 1 [Candidatus Nanopelagicales bacterium]
MNARLSVARYGDHAWLIKADNYRAVTLAESIRRLIADNASLNTTIDEVVPGARTVLVIAKPGTTTANLGGAIADLLPEVDLDDNPETSPRMVRLEVTYDGADLHPIATELGLSPEALIRMHSESIYEVAFCGFAPGFAYLTGLNPRLHLPRLNTPRPQVPAGSVAIADSYSSVYPQASPGGWRLLGHTNATLFDLDKSEPALLRPGTQVRFTPTGTSIGLPEDLARA